jgi:hypothetical protein
LRFEKLLNDETGQILRRVVVYGVVFAIFIALIVELGPLVWDRFSVSQTSDEVASAAANSYYASHDAHQAVVDATTKLKLSGLTDEEIAQCQIYFLPADSPTKLSVRVTVVEYANSWLLQKVGFLKKWARISSTHESGLSATK